ncbi:MAG: hypothetical protein ACRDTQ_04655 [Micromonosporaceae bacterium]
MSQPSRHRLALALAATAVSAPLLAFGTAYSESPAASTSADAPVVEFTDHCLPASCSSWPSTAQLRVPPESTVTFINGLGEQARLYLDGQELDPPVASGGTVAVRFNGGPVKVAMGQAGLNGTKAVTVSAVAASPSSGPTTSAPGAPSSGTTSPTRRPASASDAADRATAGSSTLGEAPDETGTPDGADLAPAEDPGDAAADGDTGLDVAALGGSGTTSSPAVEPVAAVVSSPDGGPKGLLALIATVCAIGASIGIIRAIIAQRATRTRAA